jgi:hypothetical protein
MYVEEQGGGRKVRRPVARVDCARSRSWAVEKVGGAGPGVEERWVSLGLLFSLLTFDTNTECLDEQRERHQRRVLS